jgi:hypothetical protein
VIARSFAFWLVIAYAKRNENCLRYRFLCFVVSSFIQVLLYDIKFIVYAMYPAWGKSCSNLSSYRVEPSPGNS